MEKYKKYIPLFIIGAIVAWLVLKLSKSGSTNQVVNRVIPVQDATDRNALAQTEAQFQLGKLQLENAFNIAGKQVDAEKTRLEFGNKALDLQGQYGLKALEIEAQKVAGQTQAQSDLARIALDQSLYDTQTRVNAATELQRQQNNSALLNQLLGVSGGILQALLRPQSQQKPSSSGGIGSSSGGINPTATPRGITQAERQNALARLGARLTAMFYNNQNSAIVPQNYDSLGYASGYDLDQFYRNEINAYDNYLDFGGGGINDPIGSVSSSFDFLPFDFNNWYNEEFGF